MAHSRRSLLASLGATTTVGLAGCLGGNGNGGNGGDGLPDEVVVGNVNPLSGPYSYLGEFQIRGIDMVFDEVNDSDEILPDTELTMVQEDSGTDPDQGLQAARTLVEQEEVDLLYGSALSSVTFNVMNYASQINMPHYVALSGSSEITGERCQRTTVRATPHTGMVAGAAGYYGTNNLGNTAYVMHLDDAAGRTIREEATAIIEDEGGEVVDTSAVPHDVSDWSPLIDSIRDADPDWLMMGITIGIPDFLIAAGERGLEIPICGNYIPSSQSGALTQEQFDALPELYRGGVRYTREIDTPTNNEFVNTYTDQHDKPPQYADAVGYMNALLIAHSLDAAESLETDDVIEGWRDLELDLPQGPSFIRACDHQGMPPVYSARVTGIDEEFNLGEHEILEEHDPEDFAGTCEESTCSFD